MSLITEEEKILLPQFREKVEDLLDNDFTSSDEFLVRWIRDRELNLHAAEIMLRKSFLWRQNNKIDSILSEEVDDIVASKCPYKVETFDIEGRPVIEMPAGDWRGREMIEAGKSDHLGRQVYRMMEEAVLTNRKLNHNNCEDILPLCISIVDLANLSYKQLGTKECLGTIVHVLKAVCDNYPEVIETSYVINAPTCFKIIFKILKAVIPSRYVARTHIFGKDRCEWEPILQELISPDQLRKRYGGTKENFY